ncbi:PrsW family intramembrane metalloprotease [Oscillospiraceae bacterium HV4-5-C5C]|nr:PrsW family intramembrane metalloprotease [Oscillospiraceae bacterium HV4-5-C5C]
MFFIIPIYYILLIYILAAVLPAAYLMRYVYRQDHIEKEPPALLLQLIGYGVLAALLSGLLELIGEKILNTAVNGKISQSSPAYHILLAFFVVAVVEEGMKFLLLYRRTWRDPNFNYRFDAVVYAVFTSLGFAAFENIKYVMGYGLTVAVPRALLAIPGHMSFAVFMGIFYGKAKLCSDMGDRAGKRWNIFLGYLVAVLMHGFYDACAMIGTTLSTILFVVLVAVIYLVVFKVVKRQARHDEPV